MTARPGWTGPGVAPTEDWERGADAQRNKPILTEDEEVIWRGMGSMAEYLAKEREEEREH
jgi:hypothetical protein